MDFQDQSIEFLKGVGPARADLLRKELRIFTFSDLLQHFPFRYIDKSKIYNISEIKTDLSYIQILGKIIKIENIGRGKSKRLVAHFEDDTGLIQLVWFKGIRWIRDSIKINTEYLVFGRPSSFNNQYNIVHPEIEVFDSRNKSHYTGLQAVYHSSEKLSTKGLNSKGISKIMRNLVDQLTGNIHETLSLDIINKLRLFSKRESLLNIHFPTDLTVLKKSQERLKFEELFFLQLYLIKMKLIRSRKIKGYEFPIIGDLFNHFYYNNLSFELTKAQKRVVKEIRNDMRNKSQMNRLLQGDVGSGKTLVAFLSMLIAVDNNFQSCIVAPTEILAQQHFQTIKSFIEKMDIKVSLLTGSSKMTERRILHQGLEDGSIDLLVGTHAILEEKVKFKNLGLVIIDEQHRFGVAQRSKLWKKNTFPPHILVMTATPIPRTLSMTLYGDLDISLIDELPPGRKKVKTIWKSDGSRLRVLGFIKEQIKNGRQIYIVFPLIKESEKLDYKNLIDGYESLLREFPLPDFQVSIVHGQMKSDDKEYEMKRFIKGKTNIMVATTVIEVGVDVPNASVMVIESAERFGLSQLHQLRGRVGRGSDQSYCILMSGNKLSGDAKKRLKALVESSDGFKISEIDLKLRGPGDMMGTKQSGMLDFKIADLTKDSEILDKARKAAINILKSDPELAHKKNINILTRYLSYAKSRKNWSRIS